MPNRGTPAAWPLRAELISMSLVLDRFRILTFEREDICAMTEHLLGNQSLYAIVSMNPDKCLAEKR